MLSSVRFILAISALGAMLCAGCSGGIERDPAFLEKAALLDELKKELSDTKRQVASLEAQFDKVTTELHTVSRDVRLMATNKEAVSPTAVNALQQRVEQLEESIKTSNDQLVAMEQKLDRNASADKAPSTPAAIGSDRAGTQQKIIVSSVPKKTAPPSQDASESDPAPRGVYHKVQTGETLEAIAKQYQVSVRRIVHANQLPGQVRLPAGQRLYIPNG